MLCPSGSMTEMWGRSVGTLNVRAHPKWGMLANFERMLKKMLAPGSESLINVKTTKATRVLNAGSLGWYECSAILKVLRIPRSLNMLSTLSSCNKMRVLQRIKELQKDVMIRRNGEHASNFCRWGKIAYIFTAFRLLGREIAIKECVWDLGKK